MYLLLESLGDFVKVRSFHISTIDQYFTADAMQNLHDSIREAEGQEVFFVCDQNDDGLIDEVEPLARGNATSVAALFQTARPFQVVVHNHPSGNLKPSDADVMVASQFGNNNIGSIIVNNEVSDCYVLVEPFTIQHRVVIQDQDMVDFFGEGGELSRGLEGFEQRDSQVRMAVQVAAAFNQEQVLTIEAGTGTGKSLAYLVPAINFALANRQKVVISTNTINLQEQLIKKDIPFLQQHSSLQFSAELIKGKNNYLCKKKLAEVLSLQQQELFDQGDVLQGESTVVAWAAKTRDGSQSELNFIPNEDLWEKFCVEGDLCLKVKCPYYNECFYYAARRRASTADIIVANHHLLFADLSVKQDMPESMGAILPPYKHVIVDEAHNIEEIAANYFGFMFSRFALIKLLGRLQHTKHRGRGILPEIVLKLMSAGKSAIEQGLLQKLINEINSELIPSRNKVMMSLSTYFDALESEVKTFAQNNSNKEDLTFRVRDELIKSESWRLAVRPLLEAIKKELVAFNKKLKEVSKAFDQFDGKVKTDIEFQVVSLKAMIRRLDEHIKKLGFLIEPEDDNVVIWFEWSKKNGALSCRVIPLDVAPILADSLYTTHKTVVLTSATLTIEKQFHFMEQRLGLTLIAEDRRRTDMLPSPFDYDRQVLMGIPFDMPDPTGREFEAVLPDVIKQLIMASRGRTFVLFTSYHLLNKVYLSLVHELEVAGFTPLKQGAMNRHHLLEQFKQDVHSCLFATDSFWEGVDVVGEALSSVIITRLPFRVPTDPVHEARAELIKQRGKDPFSDYAIPLAVLKFRQGVGRLIRHKTDKGIVTILDSRIINKAYGKKFVRSLFVSKPLVESKLVLYQKISSFLNAR